MMSSGEMRSLYFLCFVVTWWSLSEFSLVLAQEASSGLPLPPLSCSVPLEQVQERDPALHEMTYDVGDGPQTTWVYIEPNITTFYQNQPVPAHTKVQPDHDGFAGKFINLSNKKASLYWEERAGGSVHLMRSHEPMSASGTATFPGHRFFFAEPDQPKKVLHRFLVGTYPENVYAYDPFYVDNDPQQTEKNLKVLNKSERARYDMWRKTLRFNEQYRNFTGRSYLANYLRAPPNHFMWRADYFGQEHWITTHETHFIKPPPVDALEPILTSNGESRLIKEPALLDYRDPDQHGILNMTLRVMSCAPRVFEIPNFLSDYEVQHILELAASIDLAISTTGDGEKTERKADSRRTRTSFNSWVNREQTTIIDSIYRRAADILRIDEALMRYRGTTEYPELKTKKSIAESLQLVHYDITQQYTAHHDFGFSTIDDESQGARFATLLLYLNEGMKGGETSFPRWANAETFRQLKVTPKVGQAVLFYSQLPDGNLDDLSHHAALPVLDGEKWLINLWVWAPFYE